ncbi:MAG: hypothetical protein QOE82_3591, partial [Thermoanaerobaculia bacterium]|nr:hypothetical protein [Thermoanaerobaculia bacterium]
MIKSIATFLVFLCASVLSSQVTESIDVRIVNVDVTVTSKGAPVRGLTRDDFEILEDGRLQTITNFYASDDTRTLSTAIAPAAATTAAATPAVEQDP